MSPHNNEAKWSYWVNLLDETWDIQNLVQMLVFVSLENIINWRMD